MMQPHTKTRKKAASLANVAKNSKKRKNICMEKPDQSTNPSGNQAILVGKFNKRLKCQHVGSTMISKIHLKGRCEDNIEVFGKAFCLTMVHTGVNKMNGGADAFALGRFFMLFVEYINIF